MIKKFRSDPEKTAHNQELWRKIETEAQLHSQQLSEELRAVLEPTQISSFKGD